MNKVLIIAEAGVNHNGNINNAYKLVDIALDAGADIVKFQVFKANALASKHAEMTEYQKRNTEKQESQEEMLKKLELSFEDFRDLQKYCEAKSIKFLATAFDSESLDFLVNDLKIDLLKIPSGEITNGPFLFDHAKTNKEIIISTGMANLLEISQALKVVEDGYSGKNNFEVFNTIEENLSKVSDGTRSKVTILHCTTSYPTPLDEVNLNVIDTFRDTFKTNVGYSDHTEGEDVSVYAVAKSSSIIEKHFTIDKNMEGPDHKASLEPSELKSMISKIRNIEIILGSSEKKLTKSEHSNITNARKGLFAKTDISQGTIITEDMISIMRPATTMSPMSINKVISSNSKNSYKAGDPLNE